MDYTCDALLADAAVSARYVGGSFACLYLAPYNYHRIHMPLDGVLRATRYVPGSTCRNCSPSKSATRSTPAAWRSGKPPFLLRGRRSS